MENSNYHFIAKLFHHLVLGVPLINKASFDLDSLLYEKKGETSENHIFISGLARSGTTMLMRSFYETGQFRSFTYQDMPFILMPNLWKKISKSYYKKKADRERTHGDNIYINSESPEAFEEVFWRTFSKKEYIFENDLRPYLVNDEVINSFRLYIKRLVANSSQQKKNYLSKNNNNILRLGSIRKAFPKSIIIIPFRQPCQHAFSLLKQHERFSNNHKNDDFTYRYMKWLGHYEFGTTHKPFQFSKYNAVQHSEYQSNNINYWLNIWIDTYSYVLQNAPSDCVFVCFEDLCTHPKDILGYLFEFANISLNSSIVKKIKRIELKNIRGIENQNRSHAEKIYESLREMSL